MSEDGHTGSGTSAAAPTSVASGGVSDVPEPTRNILEFSGISETGDQVASALGQGSEMSGAQHTPGRGTPSINGNPTGETQKRSTQLLSQCEARSVHDAAGDQVSIPETQANGTASPASANQEQRAPEQPQDTLGRSPVNAHEISESQRSNVLAINRRDDNQVNGESAPDLNESRHLSGPAGSHQIGNQPSSGDSHAQDSGPPPRPRPATLNLVAEPENRGTQTRGTNTGGPPTPLENEFSETWKHIATHFRGPDNKWTLAKVIRCIKITNLVIKTLSDGRKAWRRICNVCIRLDLKQDKFIISQHSSDGGEQAYKLLLDANRSPHSLGGTSASGTNKFRLGNLRKIRLRSESKGCPFCKLVVHSIQESTLSTKAEDQAAQCHSDIVATNEDLKDLQAHIRNVRNENDRLRAELADCQAHIDGCTSHVGKCTTHIWTCTDKIEKNEIEIPKMEARVQHLNQAIATLEDVAEVHEAAQREYDDDIQKAECYASFQIDGREVIRDSAGEVVSARPRTRRIRLKWSHPDLKTAYVVFVAPEYGPGFHDDQMGLWESHTSFLARNIRMANKNDARIRSWVALCHDHHGSLCNNEPGQDFRRLISRAYFGVIDVNKMRLTSLPPGQRYVALSYTWGTRNNYTTTVKNVRLHQEPGGIDQVLARLPTVIRDAIKLVRSLGERYLWVDSLCIVQKSTISWTLNSAVMDLVYGNAYLTICAAEGEGAQTGLLALDPHRHISQLSEECAEGLRLTVSHLAETYIDKSRWNTRGWTFQERLLSRRCVIFAGKRVFFQCRSTAFSEDITGEQESAGWSIELVGAPLQMLVDIKNTAFSVYMECVRLYTKRNLGQQKDILAAFNGMGNMLAREMQAPMYFGLPTSHFDLALLWQPKSRFNRRVPKDKKEEESFGDLVFPTWSWCGWYATSFEYHPEFISGCTSNTSQWLAEHTWISWFIRDGEGNLRPLWSSSQRRRKENLTWTESRWLGYGWYEDAPSDTYGRIVKREYRKDGDKDLPKKTFQRTLSEFPFGLTEVATDYRPQVPSSDQRYLQFWTWTAHLRVKTRDTLDSASSTSSTDRNPSPVELEQETGLFRCDIEDVCGDWCGSILLDSTWFDSFNKENRSQNSIHEFIAISEAKSFSMEESDTWTYYVSRDREQADWSLFYVLLVIRDKAKKDICYRQGLGKVFKDSFTKSYLPGKEWKEIIMG